MLQELLNGKKPIYLLTEGMRMMAFIGFVMITANGFASVIQATGDIESLVGSASSLLEGNKALAAMLMLIIGLLDHDGNWFFICDDSNYRSDLRAACYGVRIQSLSQSFL